MKKRGRGKKKKKVEKEKFYRANLSHSQIVLDIMGDTYAATDMLMKLKNYAFYIFISESGKSLLSYEPVYGEVPWFLVHTYSDESERGLELKLFLLRTGLWMAENTRMEALTAVIPDRLRRYGIFLRSALGMKRLGTEMGTTVYTIGVDRYKEMKQKLNKLEGK